MRKRRQQMARLFALARRAPPVTTGIITPAIPPGFATRVAARWAAGERSPNAVDVWEGLCWRGAAVAAAVCFAAFIYSTQVTEPTAFDLLLEAPATNPTYL